MRVTKVTLTNFRNYEESSVDLGDSRNILIGENAQGKTNFLEAIEIVSLARSTRAQSDLDLILRKADLMRIDVAFVSGGVSTEVSYSAMRSTKPRTRGVERQVKVNGLTLGSAKALRGRLTTVSFKSADLNLLRGGPKFRREWIDDILITLRPAYQDTMSKYQRSVAQRNRLLKQIFERGRVSVSDQDQLKVWDEQVARFGASIIKQRLALLSELLPKAERHQEHISGKREKLSAQYIFRAREQSDESGENNEEQRAHGYDTRQDGSAQDGSAQDHIPETISTDQILNLPEAELAQSLIKLMKERRAEEIARKQTLCGPHRDDIKFSLNDFDAVEFASQGQQRSLVLACKLAELERVTEFLNEPPILLLDDVLAELDLNRQGLLMSLVQDDMQTLITTTHVSGFRPEWLKEALILHVNNGRITPIAKELALE